MKKYLFLLAVLAWAATDCSAQHLAHDKEKEKQWRSMEVGPWDFAPSGYYYLFHKKYSGAYLHWAWLGTKIKFKESKSNVKRIMPVRVAAEGVQAEKVKKVEEERQYVKELYDEEVYRQIDRSTDVMYASYKKDFNEMQDEIEEGLAYCLTKSKGKLAPQVKELTQEDEIICEGIAYIHKDGVGYELENSKRQKAYLEFKDKMKDLMARVANLVAIAQSHY